MSRRTWWYLSAVGTLTAILSAWAVFGHSAASDNACTFETIRRQDLKDSVVANGEIQPRTRVNVGTSVNGEIMAIHVADGQWVKAGDLLVTLDQERLRQDLVRSELSLNAARQDLSNARATYEKQEKTLKRRSELFDQGIASSEDYQQEKLNFKNAETQLERSKVGIQQAEAAVAQAKDTLSKTVIRAPISGQVTGLKAEKGETAIAGQTNLAGAVLMVISDLSEMMAELKVGELDVVKVKTGEPAEVSVDALPGRIFLGKVLTVASGTDRPTSNTFGGGMQETQSYKVRVQLAGTPQELQSLRPGMSARIAILTAERKAVLAVPLAAIQERESKTEGLGLMTISRSIVFVARAGKAEERNLRTGLSTRRAVEVLDGLKEGEQIITGPTKVLSTLSNGKAITLKKEADGGGKVVILGTQFRETFRTALTSLGAHRLRSALTTLGIIIGVASVITVVDLTKGLEGRIMADVKREGSHTFFLSSWVPLHKRTGSKIKRMPMDLQTVRELRELVPEILIASPQTNIWNQQMMVKMGSLSRRVTYLTAIDENGLDLGNLDLACGRPFTAVDRITRANVAILGAKLAEDLGFTEASLGRTFTVNGQTAELIGILKKHGDVPFMPEDTDEESTAMWGPDAMFYIPFGSFRELARPASFENPFWRLQVDGRVPVKEAETSLRLSLRRIRGLQSGDVDNFMLESNSKAIEQVEKISRTLMLASGAMVGISLLVGGIGVMNIMLVSVTERTREIGVRKAMGARRRHILVQFLIEAMVLCILGGLIGLVLGMGFGTLLSQLLMKNLGSVPLWSIAASLMVPGSVGLLFGLYPANRAAKLDPIEALRYE